MLSDTLPSLDVDFVPLPTAEVGAERAAHALLRLARQLSMATAGEAREAIIRKQNWSVLNNALLWAVAKGAQEVGMERIRTNPFDFSMSGARVRHEGHVNCGVFALPSVEHAHPAHRGSHGEHVWTIGQPRKRRGCFFKT